jgi:modulator of FtsH protease
MGLYDRQYNQPKQSFSSFFGAQGAEEQTNTYADSHDISDINAFVKKTYQLFAASLLAGSAGAYAGIGIASTIQSIYWLLVIAELALIFGLNFVRHKPGINLLVLFAFTFISGLTLAPMLSSFLNMPGGGAIIGETFLMTSAAFGGLTFFAMNTKRDFSAMGKMLFIALIVLIVGSLANIFLHSPILQLAIAGVGAVLFSAFILYDTQNIIRGGYDSPVSAAATLYLDFLNLFVSLLQIFGLFGGSSKE